MAIQINCDRCKRFIKFVSKKELRDMEEFVICKACLETQTKITKDVERIKTRGINKITQEVSQVIELINEAISKRIAEEE
jgi:hypothetical protein